jgi:hypothetical protein
MHRYRQLEITIREFEAPETLEATVNFFQTKLPRNGGRRMFVQGSKVPSNVELLANIELLVTEDCDVISARQENFANFNY